MKLFHLSDLHIGLKLIGRDMYEDQRYILDQIVEKAKEEKPDAVLIAGDIYDKAIPPAEAVELFGSFTEKLADAVPEAEIMMISGNHDSAARLDLYRNLLSRQHVHMIGMPPVSEEEHIEKVVLNDGYGSVNFYLLPFVKPSMVRKVVGQDKNGNNFSYDETLHRLIGREDIDPSERNVLVSHQFYVPKGQDPDQVDRMASEILTIGNIDQVCGDVLEAFDYAALGHIHKPMRVGSDHYRYCGTPLACSFSEAGQTKGIVVCELLEKGTVHTRVLPLAPLREVRTIRGELSDVLAMGCSDYVSVTLTDKRDLDVIDMQDRLRSCFPNLLEIRRETIRSAEYTRTRAAEREQSPYELCCAFLADLDEEEKAMLQDVIHTVQGGN